MVKGTHNNENMCVAIANEIVNYSFIQASHNVCFTDYNFENLNIISFVVCLCAISIHKHIVCLMCYLHQKYFFYRFDKIFHKTNKFTIILFYFGV